MDTTRLREAFRQRPMTEVIDALCELEAAARAVHAAQLEALDADVKSLERAARKARAVSLAEANERHRDRFFAMRRSITMGGVRLSGFLPDADAETLVKAIERLADDVPKDPSTGLLPSFDERCADALVDMASSVLSGEQPVHGARAMVVAHVDLSAMTDSDLHPVTESGMTLSNETAQRLMCDAVVEPVFEREGRAVGRGKNRRFPEPWMRRQLLHRDGGCRFGGCTRTRGVHAHHIERWPGGPTQPSNLVMLCRHHHRLVHEGGWTVRGDPGSRLEFVHTDGRSVGTELGAEGSIAERVLGNILVNTDDAGPDDDAGG